MNSISITRWKGLKKYVERARDFAMDFYESPNSAKCYNNILTQMEIIERISEREECEAGGGRMNIVEEALQKLKEITENYDEDLNRFFRCYMRVLHWTGVCVENEGIKRGIEKDLAIMREIYIKEHKGEK